MLKDIPFVINVYIVLNHVHAKLLIVGSHCLFNKHKDNTVHYKIFVVEKFRSVKKSIGKLSQLDVSLV